jgi:hypothetical protein
MRRSRPGAHAQCGFGKVQAHQNSDELCRIVMSSLDQRQTQQVTDATRSGNHRLGDWPVKAAAQPSTSRGHLRLERHVFRTDIESQRHLHQRGVARPRAQPPGAADEHIVAQHALEAHILHQLAQQRVVEPLHHRALVIGQHQFGEVLDQTR